MGAEAMTWVSSPAGQGPPAAGFPEASLLHLCHLFGPELSYSVFISCNVRPLIPFLPTLLPICNGQFHVPP